MTDRTPPSSRESHDAAIPRRWWVRVDADFIWAANEDEARAEFVQALVEDGSLIYVEEAESNG